MKGNVNAYYWVKEASLKRLDNLWLQLYDILEKVKMWRWQRSRGFQGWWEQGTMRRQNKQEFEASENNVNDVIIPL